MHRRVDGRHVEVTCGRGRRGQSSFPHPDRAGAEWGPRPEKVKAASGPCQAPGRGGLGGLGSGWGSWEVELQPGSLQGRPLRRSRGAGLQNLPPLAFTVVARCFTATEKHSRLALSVREDGPFPPPPHPEPRADCPSAEVRNRGSPLCGGREPIRLHVQKPRLPRGINRVEQEAEKWM